VGAAQANLLDIVRTNDSRIQLSPQIGDAENDAVAEVREEGEAPLAVGRVRVAGRRRRRSEQREAHAPHARTLVSG